MDPPALFPNDFAPYTAALRSRQPFSHAPVLNSFLYSKYASSQNYYFTKDVNALLAGQRTSFTISFTDNAIFDGSTSSLKRVYRAADYPTKIKYLCEYYKYHDDVPRFFQLTFAPTVYNFYDKKRRIKYITITKLLNGDAPGEKINIHDSEAPSESQPEMSSHSSLISLLPIDLKKSLFEAQERNRREPRPKRDRRAPENKSVTVTDLCDVLSEIFANKDAQESSGTKRKGFQTEINEQRLSLSSVRKFWGDSKPRTIPNIGCESPNLLLSKEADAGKGALLCSNLNSKNIMVKKFNNEKFLRVLAKKLGGKEHSRQLTTFAPIANTQEGFRQTLTKESRGNSTKGTQQLKINNLNININFNNLSKTDAPKQTRLDYQVPEEVQTGKDHHILITLQNPKERGLSKGPREREEDIKQMDSPTYSLLHRFKIDPAVQPDPREKQPAKDRRRLLNFEESLSRLKGKGFVEGLDKLRFAKKKSSEKVDLECAKETRPQITISSFKAPPAASSLKHNRLKPKSNPKKLQTSRLPADEIAKRRPELAASLFTGTMDAACKGSLQKQLKLSNNFELKCAKNANILFSKQTQKVSPFILSQKLENRRIFMSHEGLQKKAGATQEPRKLEPAKAVSRETLAHFQTLKAHRTMDQNSVGGFYKIFDKTNFLSKNKISGVSSADKGLNDDQTLEVKWKNVLRTSGAKRDSGSQRVGNGGNHFAGELLLRRQLNRSS